MSTSEQDYEASFRQLLEEAQLTERWENNPLQVFSAFDNNDLSEFLSGVDVLIRGKFKALHRQLQEKTSQQLVNAAETRLAKEDRELMQTLVQQVKKTDVLRISTISEKKVAQVVGKLKLQFRTEIRTPAPPDSYKYNGHRCCLESFCC
eukprot:Colp12_sorted_trinity150504_noHs@23140